MSYTLSDIRDYFASRIAEVDPNLLAYDQDPFGIDDVGDTIAERYYKLIFGVVAIEKDGNHYREEIECNLEIYAPRQRDEIGNFDQVLQKAIDIKDLIVCPEFVKGTELFTEIGAQSITPSPLGEDDKAVSVNLNFLIVRLKSYS